MGGFKPWQPPSPGLPQRGSPPEPGTPAGIPGQGRRQLGGGGSSLGSRPSCAISEGCDQGEGSVLPGCSQGWGGGSCLRGLSPRVRGRAHVSNEREEALRHILGEDDDASNYSAGWCEGATRGLEAGVRWAGIDIRTKPAL